MVFDPRIADCFVDIIMSDESQKTENRPIA